MYYSLIGVHNKKYWDSKSNLKIGFKRVCSWKVAKTLSDISGCSFNTALETIINLDSITLSKHQKESLEKKGFEFMLDSNANI